MATDLFLMPAVELQDLYRRRELSPVEVIDAVLDRIVDLDGQLNAFCTIEPERVRDEARTAEASFLREDPVGPLSGIPVGIKDVFLTKGMRTTFGAEHYRDFVPDEDEIAVERLRGAGAIILGKTNVPELGFGPGTQNPLFAVTRNPWDPSKTPASSSGGSAVAVASGMGPIALGGDGGGSVRVPASFCGVFGLKPSAGRIPMYPTGRDVRFPSISGFETLEAVGPITRTVTDAALVMDVLVGPDRRDRHSLPREPGSYLDLGEPDLSGLRVAWTLDLEEGRAVDPNVRELVEAAAERFEDLGANVENASPRLDDPRRAFAPLVAMELESLRRLAAQKPDAINERVTQIVSEAWTYDDVSAAIVRRQELYNTLWRFFDSYDLLLTPTVPVAPYPADISFPPQIDGRPVTTPYVLGGFTAPFNLSGNPAASVPCGWTAEGLPVGLQIVGPHLGDRLVLRASRAFEIAAPWTTRPIPVRSVAGHGDGSIP